MNSSRTSSPGAATAKRWPLMLAVVSMLGVFILTAWLRSQVRHLMSETRDQVSRLFEGKALGGGADEIDFTSIIQAADQAVAHPLVRHVFLYRIEDSRFSLIYPYWGVTPEGEATSLVDGTFLRDGPGGATTGAIHIEMDESIDFAADAAVALAFLLMIGALWTFLRSLFRQEVRLQSTTIELEEKRRQLIATERLALAGRLLSSLLHDLRKPVQAIRAVAQMNVPTLTAPEEEIEEGDGWNQIVDQTNIFQGILQTTKLERFARGSGGLGEAQSREWCDLHDLIERSLNLVQYERGDVVVERELAERPLLIEANPYELLQVISNIVLNAYQALAGRGRLIVRSMVEGQEPADAVLHFDDDGPGIPPEQRAAIFEPFHTTRGDEGGTGLGMFIAREIVRALGGDVAIDDSPEGGARVTIRLPLPAEERETDE